MQLIVNFILCYKLKLIYLLCQYRQRSKKDTQTTNKLETMKRLEKKIDRLIELIEFGIYTRKEAFYNIRELKAELDEMYEQGTDKHQTLLYLLIDAHNLADELI